MIICIWEKRRFSARHNDLQDDCGSGFGNSNPVPEVCSLHLCKQNVHVIARGPILYNDSPCPLLAPTRNGCTTYRPTAPYRRPPLPTCVTCSCAPPCTSSAAVQRISRDWTGRRSPSGRRTAPRMP